MAVASACPICARVCQDREMESLRPINRYISAPPQDSAHPTDWHFEAPTSEYIWFRLRQLADVPEDGMALFVGTLKERRAKYRYFQAFVRQANVYWDAAQAMRGSAAALPYYYGILQLAKAELLLSVPERVMGVPIKHGLSHKTASGTSIRQDRIRITDGVFPLLYKHRTGLTCPRSLSPKVMSLLSMVPEIGMEMRALGPTRTPSVYGYHAVALDDSRAWSMLLFLGDLPAESERLMRRILRGYDEVHITDLRNWRETFALSTRVVGRGARLFQAKATYTDANGKPDIYGAIPELLAHVGDHFATPVRMHADFALVPTVTKSSAFVIPLPLLRYALMFYLSSLVRYEPVKLDSNLEGAQSFVMDSFVHEVPLGLLAAALDGITGRLAYFDPSHMRV